MRRFTELFLELDRTTRSGEKVAALRRYFEQAPPEDAAWALRVLTRGKLVRAIGSRKLRRWASEVTGLPAWLVDESYQAVGDLSETLSLLLPRRAAPSDEPLHRVIERRILVLGHMDEAAQREAVLAAWGVLDTDQRLVFHKLISGSFRVGVSAKRVTQALAQVAGIDPAVMQHRLLGRWEPTAAGLASLLSAEDRGDDPGRPYPFFLASPWDADPAELGPIEHWRAEWKWDGIRAQLVHRRGRVMLWSRGQELIGGSFPELVAVGRRLPDGTVLDGEVLAWEEERPLPFGLLQRRLQRKGVQPALFPEVPVVFMAYDALEAGGEDLRAQPTDRRRARLEELARGVGGDAPLRVSPRVEAGSWAELGERQRESRRRGVEGLMLKRAESPYRAGRVRGDWWKWKIDPHTIDAVLVQAQPGHGRRAGLLTDYGFAVWDGGELVVVAKAYSGLTDAEISEVDRFVRRHTMGKAGPVRFVEPTLVFELAFEAIQRSDRHKCGLALRFPRMARWRRDKTPEEADTLDALRRLLEATEGLRAAPGGTP